MERRVQVTCPYCGQQRSTAADDDFGERKLTWCLKEAGGCGRQFVVDITVTVTTVGLKIEGEENK